MKAYVTTIVRQELEVPEDWEREDIYEFLAEHQSFRSAFQGVSDKEGTATIVDIMVLEEEVTELGDVAYDN